MQRYIFRRLVQGLIAVFLIGIIVFVLARVSGDPLTMMLPLDATQADREHLARALGLDQPYHVQFLKFVAGAVKGDFGKSIKYGRPATELFFERLPNSLRLVTVAYFLALLFGIPLGVAAAVGRGTAVDTLAKAIAVSGMSIPSFLTALLLIELFSVRMGILPVSGFGTRKDSYVLPAVTLAYYHIAGLVRLIRSSMLEVLDSEFVKLAHIKAVPERTIIWWHSLRNALIPVVSFAGVQIAVVITGAVVIETVFAWPGTGRLAYEAVIFRDFPLIQTVVILHAVFTLLISLAVDIVYAYLDPRIRYV